MFAKQIGIDLGTANIIVYVRGKGIVLTEPSVVALATDERSNRPHIVAVGEEARLMLGRTPGNIHAQKPMRDGVIADYVITEYMLKHFIDKVCGRVRIFHPQLMICIPSGGTSVEQRAVKDAAIRAGAREAFLIPEPLAAAIPVAVTAAESVDKLRTWASGRCLSASSPGIYQRSGSSLPKAARRVQRPSDN